jgi:methyl-accepting chemotaxis protein
MPPSKSAPSKRATISIIVIIISPVYHFHGIVKIMSDSPISKLETIALSATKAIGSIWSVLVHTFLFILAFVLIFIGYPVDRVLLVLTTVVSLEAIYLSIFIQMSVNHQARALATVEKEIDEIAEDVEGIAENVEEMQEDMEEISHDVEEIQEDVEEIQETHEEIQEDIEEIQKDVDDIAENVEEMQEDVEEIQEDIDEMQEEAEVVDAKIDHGQL